MIDFVLDILGFLLKVLIVMGVVVLPLVVLALSARKKGDKGEAAADEVAALITVDLKKQGRKRHKLMTQSVKRADPEQILTKRAKAAGLSAEVAGLSAAAAAPNAATKDAAAQDAAAQDAAGQEDAAAGASAPAGDAAPAASATAAAAADKPKKGKKALKAKLEAKCSARKEFVSELAAKRAAGEFCPRNLFVLDFRGSTKGREFKDLRLKIDAILEVADERDEVIVNLCSPGGMVNSYGLCASQLERLRARNIFLTVTVDEVAASGGYLMACVANKIVAAPFAYVGSIGVIAGIPNFRRVLNKYDVDYEQITAGKFKRTLSVLGENTEEGRQKFKEELEAVHQRFKEQVLRYRPHLDAAQVTTGEHWLALDAKELGLVDEIATSDEYIAARVACTEHAAIKIKRKKQVKRNLVQKYLPFAGHLAGLLGQSKGRGTEAASLAAATRQELNALDDSSFMHLK